MTISQSRFGGAAEVGRNYNKPEQSTDNNGDKAIASVIAGGAGAYGVHSTKKPLQRHATLAGERAVKERRKANTYAGQAKASMKQHEGHKATADKIHEWIANPTSKKSYMASGKRIVMVPGRDNPAHVQASENYYLNEAQKARTQHISSRTMAQKTGAQADKLERRTGRLFSAAKHTDKVAAGVGLAGLLGAAKFARKHEESRGTLGYKRPTAEDVKQAQVNRREEEMKQSAAEGDRYRRMNGL